MPKPDMLWIDLETTGLKASEEVPLEMALVLTDRWGTELASQSWLVWEPDTHLFRRAVNIAKTHPIVGPMHEKSGLWNDLESLKYGSYRTSVAYMAIDWLKNQGVEQGDMPLSGNSIGSLDRPFVQEHFPGLNGFLHYRNIDMSSLKEIVKLVNPDLYEQFKPIIGTKENALHRAYGDCRASIAEYRVYLENFLMADIP